MMNHMKEVAKLLGVEFGEEFKIKGSVISFKLTEEGLFDEYKVSHELMLSRLLAGELVAEKPLFKPSKGDYYYTYVDSTGIAERLSWDEDLFDLAQYKAGIVFRTREEAKNALEAKKQELLDFYTNN